MKKQEKNTPATEKVKQITDDNYSKTDPQGSYTGIPKDKYEKPVQDADDL